MIVKNDEQLKKYKRLLDTGSLKDKLKIESIDMGWMNFSDKNDDFYRGIIKTISNFPNLITLDISNSVVFNLDWLGYGQGLSNLTKLNLNSCEKLENIDGLLNCKNIKNITLISCSKLKNVNILENLKKIKKLNLNYCNSLENIDFVGKLEKLEEFSINTDIDKTKSLQIPDSINKCVNLESLEIANYNSEIPKTIVDLKKLKNLSLSTYKMVLKKEKTNNLDDSIIKILSNLKNIQELDLCGNLNVTEKGLKYLETLSKLKRLDLTHIKLADAAVQKLKNKKINVIWELFEKTLIQCKNLDITIDELEKLYDRFLYGDECIEGWKLGWKSYSEQLTNQEIRNIAIAIARNPNCSAELLKKLFDYNQESIEWNGWLDDGSFEINILNNPNCSTDIYLDVLKSKNKKLNKTIKNVLKPAGFGRFSHNGKIIAKLDVKTGDLKPIT